MRQLLRRFNTDVGGVIVGAIVFFIVGWWVIAIGSGVFGAIVDWVHPPTPGPNDAICWAQGTGHKFSDGVFGATLIEGKRSEMPEGAFEVKCP